MKPIPPEKFRLTPSRAAALGWPLDYANTAADGMQGIFLVENIHATQPSLRRGGFDGMIRCVVHDGRGTGGWEHVSASFDHRVPTWEEMCLVKATFWCEDEVVVQYHPAKKDYINTHPHTLHLWRHRDLISPPSKLV